MLCENCSKSTAVGFVAVTKFDKTLGTFINLTPKTRLCSSCIRKVCRVSGLEFPRELEEEIPNIFEDGA